MSNPHPKDVARQMLEAISKGIFPGLPAAMEWTPSQVNWLFTGALFSNFARLEMAIKDLLLTACQTVAPETKFQFAMRRAPLPDLTVGETLDTKPRSADPEIALAETALAIVRLLAQDSNSVTVGTPRELNSQFSEIVIKASNETLKSFHQNPKLFRSLRLVHLVASKEAAKLTGKTYVLELTGTE